MTLTGKTRNYKTEYGMTPRHSEFPDKSREVIGVNSRTTCRAVIPHNHYEKLERKLEATNQPPIEACNLLHGTECGADKGNAERRVHLQPGHDEVERENPNQC